VKKLEKDNGKNMPLTGCPEYKETVNPV
jgi:hypothetical protein